MRIERYRKGKMRRKETGETDAGGYNRNLDQGSVDQSHTGAGPDRKLRRCVTAKRAHFEWGAWPDERAML